MIKYNVIEYKNTFWQVINNCAYLLSSPISVINFDEVDFKSILKMNKLFLIRYEVGMFQFSNTNWWHITKTDNFQLDDYGKKVRYNIRKSLKLYSYVLDSPGKYHSELYSVYKNVVERHESQNSSLNYQEFKLSLINRPSNCDFWIVRNEFDEIVGYADNYVSENHCFYNSIWITTTSLKNSASYGLFYAMNLYYLGELNLDYVSDGARSISHATNIQSFLISKFGFNKSFSNLKVIYSKRVSFLIFIVKPFKNIINFFDFKFLHNLKVLLLQDQLRNK